jgi:hypothetical protein
MREVLYNQNSILITMILFVCLVLASETGQEGDIQQFVPSDNKWLDDSYFP